MTSRHVSDFGPPERARHGDALEIIETGRAGVVRARVAENMLRRYFDRGFLADPNSERENRSYLRLCAGGQLREDFHRSGLEQSVTGAFSEPIGGGTGEYWLHGHMESRKRYLAAHKALGASWGVVCRVCIDDNACGSDGLPELRRGLDVLARRY